MPHSGTSSTSRRRERRRRAQRGSTLIATIGLTAIMGVTAAVSLSWARSSDSGSSREGREGVAVQVADAGVNQYVSRLVEDPRYWDHWVDKAEDPRIDPSGVMHPPGSPWVPGTPWTYPEDPETWQQVQDARFGDAAYSLRISPPAGDDAVTIRATASARLASRSARS